jgi:hypothetical protein
MIEYELPYESFIGGWFISEKTCDDVIDYFNRVKDKLGKPGRLGYGIDKKKKDSLDVGVHQMNFEGPIKSYREQLQKCLDNYEKRYGYVHHLDNFNINTSYAIQYYKPGGGFKEWHCERPNSKMEKRCLVFMTYLNNVDEGGTEFYHQKIITPAKKGLTLIWPTDWTHTHKGQISKTQEKFIVTGWYSFNK